MTSAADGPPADPLAVRVVEASAGGEAGEPRLVVDPAGDPDFDVRRLGDGRAVVTGPGLPDNRITAVEGSAEPADRDRRARREIVVGGWRAVFEVESESRARLRERARRGREDASHGGPLDVRAIIPGRVVGVSVAEGEAVEAGQQLLVIEAMKMQNELRSPRAGTVERVVVGAGQTVDLGALLLVLR
jgi:biotin carboxyl carrier protein